MWWTARILTSSIFVEYIQLKRSWWQRFSLRSSVGTLSNPPWTWPQRGWVLSTSPNPISTVDVVTRQLRRIVYVTAQYHFKSFRFSIDWRVLPISWNTFIACHCAEYTYIRTLGLWRYAQSSCSGLAIPNVLDPFSHIAEELTLASPHFILSQGTRLLAMHELSWGHAYHL